MVIVYDPPLAKECGADECRRLATELSVKIMAGEKIPVSANEFVARALLEWAASLPLVVMKRGNPKNVKKIGDAQRHQLLRLLMSGKTRTAAFEEIAEGTDVSKQAVEKALRPVADAYDFARNNPSANKDSN